MFNSCLLLFLNTNYDMNYFFCAEVVKLASKIQLLFYFVNLLAGL